METAKFFIHGFPPPGLEVEDIASMQWRLCGSQNESVYPAVLESEPRSCAERGGRGKRRLQSALVGRNGSEHNRQVSFMNDTSNYGLHAILWRSQSTSVCVL